MSAFAVAIGGKADIGTNSNLSALDVTMPVSGVKTCLMQIGCYFFESL